MARSVRLEVDVTEHSVEVTCGGARIMGAMRSVVEQWAAMGLGTYVGGTHSAVEDALRDSYSYYNAQGVLIEATTAIVRQELDRLRQESALAERLERAIMTFTESAEKLAAALKAQG